MIAPLLVLLALPPLQHPRMIRVDPRGPVPSVAAALASARDGDTVLVEPGRYREPPLTIGRRIVLLGRPGAVLDGGGTHEILNVTADSVVIRGLTLEHVGTSYMEDRAAIRISGATGCVIEDNRLVDAFFGIYLAKAADCRVSHNVIRGEARSEAGGGNAIHLWYSRGIVVDSNDVSGHRDGIYLEFSRATRVRGNRSTGNLRYGLHFMYSDSCSYRDNLFQRNGAGVAVMYSRSVVMDGNRFADNRGPAAYGLLLKEIKDSRVVDNRFVGNSIGLYLESADRILIAGNEFDRNGWAVQLMGDASDDTLRSNAFRANSFDMSASGTEAEGTLTGNYWDRYAGYDLDRDGIGDVPFHPVRLFSVLAQQQSASLILMRSFLMDLLDVAERVLPILTPERVVDTRPLMRWSR